MTRAVALDGEVVELLADEPELFALADAVAATQRAPVRRRLGRRVAVLAALVATGAAVAAAIPDREGRSGVVSHALAALGAGPVVHATIRTQLPSTHVVDLDTGARRARTVTIEYWFDSGTRRLHTVVRQDGSVTRDVLQTGGVAVSSGAAATRAAGAPALDPALEAFARGYRSALRSGRARAVGTTVVRGRPAAWLEIRAAEARERVAVDAETYVPLLLVPLTGGRPGLTWRILGIETTARAAADFTRPRRAAPTPFRGDVRSSTPTSSAVAASLTWDAVWLGETWGGLRLVAFDRQTLTRGYPPGGRVAVGRGEGLRLRYAADGARRFVEVTQSPRPEPAYAFTAGRSTFTGNPVPAEGSAEIVDVGPGTSGRCLAQLRSAGAYVSVWASARSLCVAAARELTPIAG